VVAKRKQERGHITGDAKLNQALAQLGDVLAEIARTSTADDPPEEGIEDSPALAPALDRMLAEAGQRRDTETS